MEDLESVKSAAKDFLSKEKKLNVLFNNAGVMAAPTHLLTKQNYDLQFGVNVVAHYLFTKLLTPALENTDDARVVHTSSLMQNMVKHPKGIDFDEVKDCDVRRNRKLDTWKLYGYSKIGNTVIANIFNQQQQNISHSSCHPGIHDTGLQRHMDSRLPTYTITWMLYPPSYGALTQLRLGTEPGETKGNVSLIDLNNKLN